MSPDIANCPLGRGPKLPPAENHCPGLENSCGWEGTIREESGEGFRAKAPLLGVGSGVSQLNTWVTTDSEEEGMPRGGSEKEGLGRTEERRAGEDRG